MASYGTKPVKKCATCGRDADAAVNSKPYCHIGSFPTHYQMALYEEVAPQQGDDTDTGRWLRAMQLAYGEG